MINPLVVIVLEYHSVGVCRFEEILRGLKGRKEGSLEKMLFRTFDRKCATKNFV